MHQVAPKTAPRSPKPALHRGPVEPVTAQGGGTNHAGVPREATTTATVAAMAAAAGLCILTAFTAVPMPVVAEETPAASPAFSRFAELKASKQQDAAAVPPAAPPPAAAPSEATQKEIASALAQDAEEDLDENPYAPEKIRRQAAREAAKSKAPVLSPEEKERRHTADTKEVKEEDWYKRGKLAFVAKCAGCHPAGSNTINLRKTLFWEDMEKYGYRDLDKLTKIIRYGQGKMPGFAPDCAAEQEYTNCGVSAPLSEETLQDVSDFVINRANKGWKGRV